MANLRGFCGADPSACNFTPPGGKPLGPCPPPEHPPPCASDEVFNSVSGCCFPGMLTPARAYNSPYGAQIAGALYRIAAFVGAKVICPVLPEIGAAAVTWFGLPAELVIPGLGTVEAIEVGSAIGKYLQAELCPSAVQ